MVGRSFGWCECVFLSNSLFVSSFASSAVWENQQQLQLSSIDLFIGVCVCEREQENARTFAGVAFVNEIVLLPPPHSSKMCVARNNHCIHQCTQNTAKESLCDEFYDIMFKWNTLTAKKREREICKKMQTALMIRLHSMSKASVKIYWKANHTQWDRDTLATMIINVFFGEK